MAQLTLLCIACYFKGVDFLKEAKRLGCRVLLVTSQKLEDQPWPRESIDEFYYMPDEADEWDLDHLVKSVSYLARTQAIDRIVPLDDYDLEKAARLREHLRVPGMGETRTRYFRDKLAMRSQARESGILVPDFVHVLNQGRIAEFAERVAAPWVCKPRSQASATGIKKIENVGQLWEVINALGDDQANFLLEKFVPGEIYHADSIIFDEKVLFARIHKYGSPPMEVAHEGGVFCSATLDTGSPEELELQDLNRAVIRAMGLRRGVSHTEFIKAHEDGRFYFLETAARVGGAHIAEMVEASSGVNLWKEWARIETLPAEGRYELPPVCSDHSGIIISLARQESPDTSAYQDPEIVWRLNKKNHVGLIVRSRERQRILELLDDYTQRFYQDFFATQPLQDRPSA